MGDTFDPYYDNVLEIVSCDLSELVMTIHYLNQYYSITYTYVI